MLMKHTPGPWHMVETEPGIDAEIDVFVETPRYAGGTGLIARVMNADDALLIAAAPDLLAALQTIAASTSSGGTLNRIALAAIAAATGR
jgi:hypothetical protein